MLNFLQKHLVVCNSRLILGTIAVSESVTLTQWACEKWHDIKPHNNYSFQGKRISHFLWIKLPSPRLHVYTPYLAPSFLLNKTIKYSMSNKINTRFSEYTNGYNFFFSFKLKLIFLSFICDASIEITYDENLQCKSIQLT